MYSSEDVAQELQGEDASGLGAAESASEDLSVPHSVALEDEQGPTQTGDLSEGEEKRVSGAGGVVG